MTTPESDGVRATTTADDGAGPVTQTTAAPTFNIPVSVDTGNYLLVAGDGRPSELVSLYPSTDPVPACMATGFKQLDVDDIQVAVLIQPGTHFEWLLLLPALIDSPTQFQLENLLLAASY